jgi:hypothetical protein
MNLNSMRRNTGLFVAVFAAVLAMMPRTSSAQKKAPEIHMCSLLTDSDVAPIVGAKQVTQETKGGSTCMWGDPGNDPNKPRLLIQAPGFEQDSTDPVFGGSTPAQGRLEASFKANRKQAFDDKSSQAKNEAQLGKNAFSALMDDGAEIIVLKKAALLNIRFLIGKRGTPENVEALRKVAAKVSASF